MHYAHSKNMHTIQNKANLRNLIAATGQVILLKLDSNRCFLSPSDLEITLNSGQNLQFFVPCDLEIWRITLKNNRATLLYCFKLCASFHSHQWFQSGVTVRKRPILVKIEYFFSRVILKFDGWHKKNSAPLISNIKLCASFHHHMWIQTGVTIRKRLSWVLNSVNLTFDLWPFAWTSHLPLVITPENFMMIS